MSVTFDRASDADMMLETERLMIQPASVTDASDAFALLSNSSLEFVETRPPSVEEMEASIKRGRSPTDEEDLIHYEWAVRRRCDGTLVAFVSCNIMRKVEIQSVHGEPRAVELCVIEPTVYVHPSEQGNWYGPETVQAIEDFARTYYGATEARPKIDPRNARSRELAQKQGATRILPSGIYDPLETWSRPLR
jgi:RimJ/RimL family protein N-acetyltransferase